MKKAIIIFCPFSKYNSRCLFIRFFFFSNFSLKPVEFKNALLIYMSEKKTIITISGTAVVDVFKYFSKYCVYNEQPTCKQLRQKTNVLTFSEQAERREFNTIARTYFFALRCLKKVIVFSFRTHVVYLLHLLLFSTTAFR